MISAHKLLLFLVGFAVIFGGIWFVKSPSEKGDVTATSKTELTENNDLAQATTTSTTTQKTVSIKPSTTTLQPAKKLETYTNGVYKFTLSYPKEYQVEQFSTFHELNNVDWRVNATPSKRGTPVIAVPVLRIDQGSIPAGKKYPLYFTAEVRVGVSPDVAQCYSTDNGYANQKITSVVINGVTFKKFEFSDEAMMKYVKGSSYRTIYANKCYVIEQVRNGTVYKDDTMIPGYAESELDAIYNKTTPIVYSFKFI